MRVRAVLLIAALLSIVSPAVLAWDATGHRLVAAIAYTQLTPIAKKRIASLLHDTRARTNDRKQRESLVFTKRFVRQHTPSARFLAIAAWPDTLYADDVTAFNHWHFIDYPWTNDGTRLGYYPSDNVVWAIGQCQQVLESNKSSHHEKAFFLAFLVHIVGDAHQPLHCESFYSHQFLQGDHGGNLYPIHAAIANNLHHYWDQGAGLFHSKGKHYPLSNRAVWRLANKLMADYPRARLAAQSANLNAQSWTRHSFQIAKDSAYQIPQNTSPSKAYQAHAESIAAKRIVLAGYRLAAMLNQLFT